MSTNAALGVLSVFCGYTLCGSGSICRQAGGVRVWHRTIEKEKGVDVLLDIRVAVVKVAVAVARAWRGCGGEGAKGVDAHVSILYYFHHHHLPGPHVHFGQGQTSRLAGREPCRGPSSWVSGTWALPLLLSPSHLNPCRQDGRTSSSSSRKLALPSYLHHLAQACVGHSWRTYAMAHPTEQDQIRQSDGERHDRLLPTQPHYLPRFV